MSVEPMPVSIPSTPHQRNKGAVSPGVFILKSRSLGFGLSASLSLFIHVGTVLLLMAVMFILQLLGISIPLFAPLEMKEREITFVLVENPTAPPRDKNTKNRAKHATRAGGQKVKNMAEAEPQKMAGAKSPQPPQKPTPQPQPAKKPTPQKVARAVTKPQPQPKPTPAPVTQPTPTVAKTPPKPPTMPKPSVTPTKTPALPPNPLRPTIKTPSVPIPKVATGPLVRTPSGSSGQGRGSSTPTSSQIPGGTSIASSNSGSYGGNPSTGGRTSGAGGYGAYNQSGSPGGGGGRPGIDALPEPDYGAYMAELQRRIKRNWRPPTAQEDKRVVVLFKIARDGRLIDLSVKESSGYKEADSAAMGAVKLSAPFRPLPPNHPDNDLAVQFTFDYNVYKASGGGVTNYR